jgi:dTDP-4-dehydrorhamnose 3,5-epimerase
VDAGESENLAMNVQVLATPFAGVHVIQPDCFQDNRGFFMESYHRRRLLEHGLDFTFVQDNHSRSSYGVLRGFHYQDARAPQVRLVRCPVGEIFDVIVDLRLDSATFGRYFSIRLSAENRKQLLIPAEFAHGFLVLSEVAEVQYKCTGHHDPAAERSLAWNDPEVAVSWPLANPILSVRDQSGPSLADYRRAPAFPSTTLSAR